PHYDAVAERIGVCGERDDLETFFPSSAGMLPPLEVDTSAEIVLDRYARRRETLNRDGFFLGRARLAVCTAAHRGRGPHACLVLRSLGHYDEPVPLLCNPYTYVPTLNTAMLRRRARDRRYSLAQLTAVLRVPGGRGRIVQAQLFSYRSLLTFKLMKETPLAY